MTRILFVCLGNICRSPSAEAVVATKAARAGVPLTVDSAGTGAWHIGEPPYGAMVRAAAPRGYDLSPLRARKFTSADFSAFDLIVVMDDDNLRDVEAQRPTGNSTPVARMMAYAPEAGINAVPDPYYTREFDRTLDLIERAADGLVASLSAGAP